MILADDFCPTLDDPENGSITLTIGPTGISMAMYNCDTGYALTGGNPVRTCTGETIDGQEWTGTEPSCEGIYIYV